jgi:hypothetical protein
VRALLCFGRACLRSGLLRLGFLGRHVTLRCGLVLLGLAFLLERLVLGYGPGRFLGSTLHVFYGAFGDDGREPAQQDVLGDGRGSFPRVHVLTGHRSGRQRWTTLKLIIQTFSINLS